MTLGISGQKSAIVAHNLAFCMKESRAREVYLFSPDGNKNIIPLIENAYAELAQKNTPPCIFIPLNHVDDIHHCFFEIRNEYEKLVKEDTDVDIILNYNYGTKSMTSAMTSLALLTHRTIFFIDGSRNKEGGIIPGTERISQQTLYPIYDEMLIKRAVEYFNRNQFSYAIQELDQVCLHEQKDNYTQLFMAYEMWDRFDHQGAYDIFNTMKFPGKNEELHSENIRFLHQLLKSTNKTERYLCVLVDLINNAQRRYDDGRHDDAVARLYRAFELIAQVLLLSNGLDDIEDKISFEQLAPKIHDRNRLNVYKDYLDGNKVLVGCGKKYQILKDIGIHSADTWHHETQSLLTKRNNSILAHGLTPVENQTSKRFLDRINSFVKTEFQQTAKKNGTNIDNLFKMSRFPQIRR
ncbi:MAG: TIGR02710 family CRISPR-associated CARF protein [Methanoregulaceae archaeon]|jgi:CRISPR-associated protein (TIGR02710 family)